MFETLMGASLSCLVLSLISLGLGTRYGSDDFLTCKNHLQAELVCCRRIFNTTTHQINEAYCLPSHSLNSPQCPTGTSVTCLALDGQLANPQVGPSYGRLGGLIAAGFLWGIANIFSAGVWLDKKTIFIGLSRPLPPRSDASFFAAAQNY